MIDNKCPRTVKIYWVDIGEYTNISLGFFFLFLSLLAFCGMSVCFVNKRIYIYSMKLDLGMKTKNMDLQRSVFANRAKIECSQNGIIQIQMVKQQYNLDTFSMKQHPLWLYKEWNLWVQAGFRRTKLCLSLASVVVAIGRAGLGKEVTLLDQSWATWPEGSSSSSSSSSLFNDESAPYGLGYLSSGNGHLAGRYSTP